MQKQNNIHYFMKRAAHSAAVFKRQHHSTAHQGVILGSSLGEWVSEIPGQELDYKKIRGLPASRVAGHKGILKITKNQLIFCGRSHLYEGYEAAELVFPVLFLHALGIKKIILTNAAGSLNPAFLPGDLVYISDHINLSGKNPLTGANHHKSPSPFVDMQQAYSPQWLSQTQKRFPLKKGVYAALAGPNYETPAEIKMLETLGAQMVGMSTVHETIAARFLGMEVLGLSCITNLAAGLGEEKISHEEVQQQGFGIRNQLQKMILGLGQKEAEQ